MAEDTAGQPEGDKKIVHTYPLVKVTFKAVEWIQILIKKISMTKIYHLQI